MPDLLDGETAEMRGSARLPYVLRNVEGVYSCSCPAWRNQSLPIERRTCKHLRQYRGEAAEVLRVGGGASTPSSTPAANVAKAVKPTAPALLLAESWDGEQDVTDWWLSEKLDGVRAYWDGSRFLSRQGNMFHAPAWFTERLPSVPLDGELWLGRKAFQRTVSIVRRHDGDESWRAIQFRMFDAPAQPAPFEERLAYLQELLSPLHSLHVGILPQQRCRGMEHLHAE